MINGVGNNLGLGKAALGGAGGVSGVGAGGEGAGAGVSGTSFSDMLKNSIEEVSKLQQDASQAVEDLLTQKTENVTGVMTAMEKADMAFKTLLAIRGKLMDAYEEIKNIAI
jgi:flagellar hook-basal body complex protein FliE